MKADVRHHACGNVEQRTEAFAGNVQEVEPAVAILVGDQSNPLAILTRCHLVYVPRYGVGEIFRPQALEIDAREALEFSGAVSEGVDVFAVLAEGGGGVS